MSSSNSPGKPFNFTEKLTSKFRAVAFLSLFGALSSAAVVVHAQDDLRSTVYGGNSKQPAKTRKTAATTPKPAAVPRKRKPRGAATKTNLVPVVFTTQEAKAEIWLNNRNIGLTDSGAQLRRNLAPGLYQVMVKKGGQILHPVQSISVTPEQTDFRLIREAPKPTNPANTTAQTENPKPKTEQEIALEVSRKVKETLENYADPTKTDSVTTADWELVLQAAQLGQLQGYTAVQIEAQRWFASGQIEMAKGNYPNAFTAFNKALEYMPNSALPFYGLGNAYLANKQPADALKAYQKALQITPNMAMAHRGLADALRLTGKEREAINSYKYAIQFGYRTPETRYFLATTLSKTGKHPDAIKELDEVAKQTPTADVYVALGNAYQAMRRDVSALEAYQKAAEIDPNSAVAFASLGDVYFKQREYVKAKDAFEKAVALDPEGKSVDLPETQKKIREATSRIK
jgi:tetratricopeptide (TPR) repeat protein